jgi:hypothetical protein
MTTSASSTAERTDSSLNPPMYTPRKPGALPSIRPLAATVTAEATFSTRTSASSSAVAPWRARWSTSTTTLVADSSIAVADSTRADTGVAESAPVDGALAVSVIGVSTRSEGTLILPGRFRSSTTESTRSISLTAFSAVSTAEAHVTSSRARTKWSMSPSRRLWCTGAPACRTAVAGDPTTCRTGTASAKLPARPLRADNSPTPYVVSTTPRPPTRAYPSAA